MKDLILILSVHFQWILLFLIRNLKKLLPDEVTEKVYAKVLDTYKRKVESISAQAYPVLKDVYDRMSHVYENVVVPFLMV